MHTAEVKVWVFLLGQSAVHFLKPLPDEKKRGVFFSSPAETYFWFWSKHKLYVTCWKWSYLFFFNHFWFKTATCCSDYESVLGSIKTPPSSLALSHSPTRTYTLQLSGSALRPQVHLCPTWLTKRKKPESELTHPCDTFVFCFLLVFSPCSSSSLSFLSLFFYFFPFTPFFFPNLANM